MVDPARSRAARTAAEQALVRVVHHYGARPEFVVLGGLVPELLCATSGRLHAGFRSDLVGSTRTALDDLIANFSDPADQGPIAYAGQMLVDHPDEDYATVAADAVLAVGDFHRLLFT